MELATDYHFELSLAADQIIGCVVYVCVCGHTFHPGPLASELIAG